MQNEKQYQLSYSVDRGYTLEITLDQKDFAKLVEVARKSRLSLTKCAKQIITNKLKNGSLVKTTGEWALIHKLQEMD